MRFRLQIVVALLTAIAVEQISSLRSGDSTSDVVTNLKLSPELHMIHATWQLLNETGRIDHFLVTWAHDTDAPRQCTVGASATNTLNCDGAQWEQLSQCTEYVITVHPQSVESASVGVNASDAAYTLSEAPPAPSLVTCSLSGSLVTVTWVAPVTECDIVSNSVSWEGDVLWSDGQDSSHDTTGATDSSFTLSDTVAYTRYTVSVAATVVGGVVGTPGTCQEQILTPEEAPSVPLELNFTDIRSSSMQVTWAPPEYINGILRSYTVAWMVGNDTETRDVDADELTYRIRGLQELTNYTISVTAVTAYAGAPAEGLVRTASSSDPHAWAIIGVIVVYMVLWALLKRDMSRSNA